MPKLIKNLTGKHIKIKNEQTGKMLFYGYDEKNPIVSIETRDIIEDFDGIEMVTDTVTEIVNLPQYNNNVLLIVPKEVTLITNRKDLLYVDQLDAVYLKTTNEANQEIEDVTKVEYYKKIRSKI